MPRIALVFAVANGVCMAAAASPSRTAAAPKRHHPEPIYYTITLDAARDPRLKSKPQQGKKAVAPAGSVRFRHATSQGSQGNARIRKR